MEKAKTTFNDLPERIDYLITEVMDLKQIVLRGIDKPEEIPKYLDVVQTLLYLKKKGVSISKSKLYKMTSGNSIPYRKMDSKLYFLPTELENWLSNQIGPKDETGQSLLCGSHQSIIKSGQNKYKK